MRIFRAVVALLVAPFPGDALAVASFQAPSQAIRDVVIEYDASVPSSDAADAFVADRRSTVRRVADLLPTAPPGLLTVDYRVYGSLEEKADRTGDTRPAHLEPGARVIHAALGPGVSGDLVGLEASVIFGRVLGPPSLPVFEVGLPVFFSERWGLRGYEYWVARLRHAGLVPPLSRALAGQWLETEAPLIAEAVAGALIGYLLATYGREGLAARYVEWVPGPAEIEALEGSWSIFLDAIWRRHESTIRSDLSSARERRTGGLPTLRGVNYGHEGYRRFDGYLSERSDDSLRRLATLGANAVAILPFAFMPRPDQPAPLGAPTGAGSETDEAVIRAISTAQELDLTVLLKPHIWLRGSWPGEIEMESEEAWDRFFRSYERWILHYALLAEIHQVPAFSIGVELSRATIGREARWNALARRIRGLYSGALVYAANWGEEVENLGFWDSFDYVGVDAYYPLSDDPRASDAELRRGAEAMLERIERVHRRYEKPVLFTEIGFASTRSPWVRPWEGHLQEQADPADQLRSYRAVLEAIEGRDWVAGMLWWEWPSDLRLAASDTRGFMPTGKPAEALLSRWFRGRMNP